MSSIEIQATLVAELLNELQQIQKDIERLRNEWGPRVGASVFIENCQKFRAQKVPIYEMLERLSNGEGAGTRWDKIRDE